MPKKIRKRQNKMSKKKNNTNNIIKYLNDLRSSLLQCIILIAIIFFLLYPFSDNIYNFIASPIINAIKDTNLIAIGVISPFLTPLKMTLILAIYIGMPFILYKIWAFVAPALYKHEKNLITPLIISSAILFYAGIFFSFYIVFPVVFEFLTIIGPSSVDFTPDISYYLSFIIKVSFAFGVAFEVPVATILLITFGVIDVSSLRKNRPYVIIAAFALGMILTPPDIISQILIAIPMWLLFELGLICSPLFKKIKVKKYKKTKKHPTWQDESHNAKMDEIEKDMNKKFINK